MEGRGGGQFVGKRGRLTNPGDLGILLGVGHAFDGRDRLGNAIDNGTDGILKRDMTQQGAWHDTARCVARHSKVRDMCAPHRHRPKDRKPFTP